jgi:hypothetical protein
METASAANDHLTEALLRGAHRRCTWLRSWTDVHDSSRTPVRYPEVVTERPRIALRQPRSLQPEQLGQLTVCAPAVPPRVSAWILWEDGVEELVPGQAVAWTKRAVRVRFGAPPHQHEVWVWAGAVQRA